MPEDHAPTAPPSEAADPSKGRKPAAPKLLTLEAGRFFAAASVLLGHYSHLVLNFSQVKVLGGAFDILHVGVPYFFVLSGFIIFTVHRKEFGRPDLIPRFLQKRATRLLPMFWAISIVMLAGFLTSPSLANERQISPLGLIADFLLLPHENAVLAISWTLRHEVVFYALFALALWLGVRAFWLLGAWIALSFALSATPASASLGLGSLIASPLNLGFALGLGAAALLARRAPILPQWCATLGGAGLAVMLVLEWIFTRTTHAAVGFGLPGTVAYLLSSTALIYGLVGLERHWRMPAAKLWRVLGGSSYLLYLIHQPLASIVIRKMKFLSAIDPTATFFILCAMAVIVALALHLAVERPLMTKVFPWFWRTLGGWTRRRQVQTS